MGAQTDFWLYVHELSLCLDAEGDSGDARRRNILSSLHDMPPPAREAILRELRYVLTELEVLDVEELTIEEQKKGAARDRKSAPSREKTAPSRGSRRCG